MTHINENGELVIDITDLLDDGTENGADLAKQLGGSASFNRALAESCVEHLLHGCDVNGAWWDIDHSIALRKKFLTRLPEVVALCISELEHKLESSQLQAKHYANVALTLSRAWENMDDEKRRMVANPAARPSSVMSKEEAMARVQKMIDDNPAMAAELDLPTEVKE